MKEQIKKLEKYVKDEQIICDLIFYLNSISLENNSLTEIENILFKLKDFGVSISCSDLSTRRKNKILLILNEIISIYNDSLMTQICNII